MVLAYSFGKIGERPRTGRIVGKVGVRDNPGGGEPRGAGRDVRGRLPAFRDAAREIIEDARHILPISSAQCQNPHILNRNGYCEDLK